MDLKFIAGACVLAFGCVAQAAGISGDSIGFTWSYPTATSVEDSKGPLIVNEAGVIFFEGQDTGEARFVANVMPGTLTLTAIRNTNAGSGDYFGYAFTDLTGNFPGQYSLVSSTFSNLSDNFYSTLNNKFTINLSGAGAHQGDTLVFALPSAVPEPESYAMLLAGMGLMGAIAKRRQQRRPAITA